MSDDRQLERERIEYGLKNLAAEIQEARVEGSTIEARVAAGRRMVEISARMRDRELAAHGITDGRPVGLELRRKLEAIGADFSKPLEPQP